MKIVSRLELKCNNRIINIEVLGGNRQVQSYIKVVNESREEWLAEEKYRYHRRQTLRTGNYASFGEVSSVHRGNYINLSIQGERGREMLLQLEVGNDYVIKVSQPNKHIPVFIHKEHTGYTASVLGDFSIDMLHSDKIEMIGDAIQVVANSSGVVQGVRGATHAIQYVQNSSNVVQHID